MRDLGATFAFLVELIVFGALVVTIIAAMSIVAVR